MHSTGQRQTCRLFLILPLLALAAFSATSEQPLNPADLDIDAGPPSDLVPTWRPVFQGVDYAEASREAPPVAVYAVRVDLKCPGIEFLATPSNGERPLDTDGQKTRAFLEEHGLQVAVNASPYGPVEDIEGSPRDINGLNVSRGEVSSPADASHAALLIGRDNRVWFDTTPIEIAEAYNAIGGFGMLLKDGKNVGTRDKRHPRTAAGTSEDGRYLYFVVIDGRQPNHSIGTTTAETAAWIQAFGTHDAINLDGGGSSTLVIEEGGKGKVMNRPIHNLIPGNERVNGNNLGLKALPIETPAQP